MIQPEFDGLRAKLYEEAITTFPYARSDDILTMFGLLNPQYNDKILGFGEGNGYFCSAIAKAIGSSGVYLVTDPSKDQLDNLINRFLLPQVQVKRTEIENLDVNLDVSLNYFDKVWSFGAFHHCKYQTKAMINIYNALRKNGKLVICDVFQDSLLARHFDEVVARYCITGHEVKFLSDEFAKTLCFLAGFKEVNIVDLLQKWKFNSERDLGQFIYKIHALTNLPGDEEDKIAQVVDGCYRILGIEYKNGFYELNWPMKALVAVK